ncbi:T-cell leukemia/lymphoma protein 1A [Elephas maximus indicus]|uniref:T-cell leukemia/lymphoma protein 1A n=1 Tax=Elephas maximus indicus TaxID=99487 RepID=UPI00054066F1|nr:T-cell leukemia/lymphoma protein 1A [Loxodonta africana]XP_049753502.1 T-cell leukemia/lymphoma protein 1A [Elephas maximus indicus]
MAQQRRSSAQSVLHPDRLWFWEKAVYLDENQHAWLPIIMERNGGLQVLMRQGDAPLGEGVCPSQAPPSPLPLLWQLYPEGQYRCSDSSYWRIVYHVKFNNTEDMLLELLPGSRQK